MRVRTPEAKVMGAILMYLSLYVDNVYRNDHMTAPIEANMRSVQFIAGTVSIRHKCNAIM